MNALGIKKKIENIGLLTKVYYLCIDNNLLNSRVKLIL